jgi:hypothetical protein
VKVDPQKDAVYIRRLTNLSNNLIDKLTSQADAVYIEVMDLRSSKSGLLQDPIGRSEQARDSPRVPSRRAASGRSDR